MSLHSIIYNFNISINNLISMVDYDCGFLSCKQMVHNSCNMGTRGLPDIYPRACGPRAVGI